MDSDYQYALLLQQQLSREDESPPKNHIQIYSTANKENNGTHVKMRGKTNLIDPSWEMIDPTPNIFALFIQFDNRFFWNKLPAVIVKWSKRMTTCAGICSYEGRGGACTISLSEPLLKLRPRKDLVETLLHEMIHAYLFVTDNNRDRDGHGPEFHKHMYRINNEAGTKITVYHDFHDEVKLYKTHWWRCNGPCQNWKPFFGMVKRASNRAPGPYDRWWADHQSKCGGSFIKIREPDSKSKKPGKLATKSVPVSDIRTFLPNSSANKLNNKILTNKNSNGLGQIKTFKDLNNTKKPKTSSGTSMNKGSGTLVVTNKSSTVTKPAESNATDPVKNDFQPFSGKGFSLKSSTSTNSNLSKTIENDDSVFSDPIKEVDDQILKEYSQVRDFWTKYWNKETKKRNLSENDTSQPKKKGKPRHTSVQQEDSNETLKDDPIPGELKNILNKPKIIVDLSERDVSQPKNKSGARHTSIQNDDDDYDTLNIKPEKDCYNILDEPENVIDLTPEDSTNCPICSKVLKINDISDHLDSCLENSFNDDFDDLDDASASSSTPKKEVNCLVCNKLICETKLNAHLESCMSNVFEDDLILEGTKSQVNNNIKNDKDKIVNCPCCSKLVKESEINSHLDVCLAADID